MPVRNTKIAGENLLNAVVSLPESEFERLIANARKLRRTLPENREIRLIQKINETVLSDAERMRFGELIEKRRDENIGDGEAGELIALTEKSERLNVKRLKYLTEIADLRRRSLREVMRELEISPPPSV